LKKALSRAFGCRALGRQASGQRGLGAFGSAAALGLGALAGAALLILAAALFPRGAQEHGAGAQDSGAGAQGGAGAAAGAQAGGAHLGGARAGGSAAPAALERGASAPGICFDPAEALWEGIARAPEISARAAVLLDAATGTALFSKNPNEEIPPASLAKLVAMHIAQSAVAEGRASMEEPVPICAASWARSQPPHSSLMFLEPGQLVTLRELMIGLAVPSGNDASVAVALRFSPSVAEFSAKMTGEARRMGLERTRFAEPSGISAENMTTAAEFAAFSREYLRLHPGSLAEFHSVREFAFPQARNVSEARRASPGSIAQPNRNALLWTFPGADGLKTGFIPASGFNVALTAERRGTRFVAVILGSPTAQDRTRDGEALLSWAFENFRTERPPFPKLPTQRLWKGRQREIALMAKGCAFTVPADRAQGPGRALRSAVLLDAPLAAPLPALRPVGWHVLYDCLGELHRERLFTAGAHERGGLFRRLWDSALLFFLARGG